MQCGWSYYISNGLQFNLNADLDGYTYTYSCQ